MPEEQQNTQETLDVELPAGDTFTREYVEGLRREAAGYRTKLREHEALGSREELTKAKEIAEALKTDQGVQELFLEAGEYLGATKDQLEGLFKKAEQAIEKAEDKKGAPLSEADIERIIEEKFRKPLVEQQEAIVYETNKRLVATALDSLRVNDDADKYVVLSLANKYADSNETNGEKLVAAVKKAHEEWLKIGERLADQHLESKRQQSGWAPKPLSGGASPGTTSEPPPKNVAEAGERVRKMLLGK